MPVVAGEAAGGADPGDSIRHAGEAGEDGLALEVSAGVGAVLAIVPAQHQIRLLQCSGSQNPEQKPYQSRKNPPQ